MTAKRILVVDDKPQMVDSYTKMLELEGFEAQGTTNGNDAIALYKSEDFDLALVDLNTPGADGLEVLTALREYDPSAAVVIFTADGTNENAVEALRLGACEFLETPTDAETLISTVQRALEYGNGAAVRGKLRSLNLSTIIQINCAERNQAHLRLRRHGQEASIFFSGGDLVHAVLGSQVGEEAIYELLNWEDGDFELEMGVPPPEQTVVTKWSGLLLEGMRRLDEESAGFEQIEHVEAQQEERVQSEMIQELARALMEIEKVVGVVITAHDGIVLAHELEEDPQGEGSVAAFVGNAAMQVGESLAMGPFEWGTVVIGKDTMLVLEQPDYHVGLLLGERASPALVVSSARSVLK